MVWGCNLLGEEIRRCWPSLIGGFTQKIMPFGLRCSSSNTATGRELVQGMLQISRVPLFGRVSREGRILSKKESSGFRAMKTALTSGRTAG